VETLEGVVPGSAEPRLESADPGRISERLDVGRTYGGILGAAAAQVSALSPGSHGYRSEVRFGLYMSPERNSPVTVPVLQVVDDQHWL